MRNPCLLGNNTGPESIIDLGQRIGAPLNMPSVELIVHGRGQSLGLALGLAGCIEILCALNEGSPDGGPKRYREIRKLLGMNDAKTTRRLRALEAVDLIEKRRTSGPKGHIWCLTTPGISLMKFLVPFERKVTPRQVRIAAEESRKGPLNDYGAR